MNCNLNWVNWTFGGCQGARPWRVTLLGYHSNVCGKHNARETYITVTPVWMEIYNTVTLRLLISENVASCSGMHAVVLFAIVIYPPRLLDYDYTGGWWSRLFTVQTSILWSSYNSQIYIKIKFSAICSYNLYIIVQLCLKFF